MNYELYVCSMVSCPSYLNNSVRLRRSYLLYGSSINLEVSSFLFLSFWKKKLTQLGRIFQLLESLKCYTHLWHLKPPLIRYSSCLPTYRDTNFQTNACEWFILIVLICIDAHKAQIQCTNVYHSKYLETFFYRNTVRIVMWRIKKCWNGESSIGSNEMSC